MTRDELELVLGRLEWQPDLTPVIDDLLQERVLVTGAAGSIGSALVALFRAEGIDVRATDVDTLDVRASQLRWRLNGFDPTVIFHLAGAKHAPDGELDPWDVCETNTIGTRNLLAAFPGALFVLASTCKACDPETAYGASKLLAERMVLNAGGKVARFVNVVESHGNVFEAWAELPPGVSLPESPCSRYFQSLAEAVALLGWSALLPSGRYAIADVELRSMLRVGVDLYPGREHAQIPPRRGDRLIEPLHAQSESLVRSPDHPWLVRIVSPHDSPAVAERRAA